MSKIFGESDHKFNMDLFLEARGTVDDLLAYFKTRDYSFKIAIDGDEKSTRFNILLVDPAGFTTNYQDMDVLTTIFIVNAIDDHLTKKEQRDKSSNWLNDISRKQIAGRREEMKNIISELLDEIIAERKAKKVNQGKSDE